MDSLTKGPSPKTAALAERYGAAIPAAGPWNDIVAALVDHRSVRSYKPDALPAGTLETLVAAASSAATSSNMQWFSVVAVTDPATKKAMAEVSGGQKHIEQCPLFLCWVADLSRNQRLSEAEKTPLEAMPYLEVYTVACVDTALAAQNAVVAAEALGLGTVYIGALRNDPARVAELLGLPKKAFVVFGLCIGYAADGASAEIKPRLPQSMVLHHGKYDANNADAGRKAYDAELEKFSRRNEMEASTWTNRVLVRLGPLKAMSGRNMMRTVLEKMGFEFR